jgi:hypothetical protein
MDRPCGHVFCSFLALVLQDELLRRCRAAGFTPEWGDVLRGLDRLQRGEVAQGRLVAWITRWGALG